MGIGRALLHQPEFLVLDEPTNGLDPQGIKEIRQLLRDLAEKRRITILISSHILSEIQQLATKIGVIHQGKNCWRRSITRRCRKRTAIISGSG